MKNQEMSEKERGITLVVLVVTIMIMMILVGVVIHISQSDNGIFNQATEATLEYTHAMVREQLELKDTEYILAKELRKESKSLVEYLEDEKIIRKTSEGKYKIEVTNLVSDGIQLGKGTNGRDVYMLENTTDLAELGKVASRQAVKIAATKINEIYYNIVYYNKDGESRIIGKLSDVVIEQTIKTITFTVDGHTFETTEGTTWYKFCQEHPDDFSCYSLYSKVYCWLKPGEGTTNGGIRLYEGDQMMYVYGADTIVESGWYATMFAECVSGDSKIINTLNKKVTLAKEISKGDSIVYYNFETNELEEGTVEKVYIHNNATNFVRYTFEDDSYLEATDYHPIYTTEGWKSYTRRNGYELPKVGDKVKTEEGYKTLTKIESYTGNEDCYDFAVVDKEGNRVDNYFANGTLVQSSIN